MSQHDPLRDLVPLAFDQATAQERPQQIQQYGELANLVPFAFEEDKPAPDGGTWSARRAFDARADEAERLISESSTPEPLIHRIKRGIGSIFDKINPPPPPEPAPPVTQDFSGVEQAFQQAGAAPAGVIDPGSATGVLTPEPEAAPGIDQGTGLNALAGAVPAVQAPEVAPFDPNFAEPVPVVDPVTRALTAIPAPAQGGPSIGDVDPNVAAAQQQDADVQAEIQRAFQDQEMLGSRRLGALKRGRQVATTGLRNAPGILGTIGRTLKPNDSLVEKLIENDVIQLTGTERGIELAATFAPPVLEVLLTKRVARGIAPRLTGPAGKLANLVGRTGAASRTGGAVTGVLEGIPTDLAIAIDNHDVGDLGLGAGIGAVFGALFPGGGQIAAEVLEAIGKNADEAAEGIADLVAMGIREGDDTLPTQLEVALATAQRNGQDDVAKVLDDAMDRLPTAMELADRRLAQAGEAATEAPTTARVEAPITPKRTRASGDLPTAAEVADEGTRPPADIALVEGKRARTPQEQAALTEVAGRPAPEQRPRRVSAEGQAGAPVDPNTRIAGPATSSPIDGKPTDPIAQRAPKPVPTGDRRANIRRRLGEEPSPGLRSEVQEQRVELEKRFTDTKTGLRNQQAWDTARPRIEADPNQEIITFDLNNFKKVNDALGMDAGDEALAEFARIVKAEAPDVDPRSIFRAGGDEFNIAVPKGEGERIGQAITDAYGTRTIAGTEFDTSARFGVGDTFAQADAAGAAAKASSGLKRARGTTARVKATDPILPDAKGLTASELRSAGRETEAAAKEADIGAKLDAFFNPRDQARAGYVDPTLLKRIVGPGLVGGGIGAVTSNEPEDRQGRAFAGATMGIMLGVGPGLVKQYGKTDTRIGRLVRQSLTPGGRFVGSISKYGEEAAHAIRRSLANQRGFVNEAEKIVRQSLEDISVVTKDLYGGPGAKAAALISDNPFERMPDEVVAAINKFMTGDAKALQEIPEALHAPLGNMRETVDNYSNMFLKEGIVEGELATTFDARIGTHLTRSYQVFDDPDWARNAPKVLGDEKWEQIKNTFKAWYRDEFKDVDITPEQMNNIIEDFLAVGEDLNPIRALQGGKLGRLDANVLARRKQVPLEVRELWGEHTDPRIQFARTVSNQSHFIANYRYLNELREQGLKSEFFFDPKLDPGAVRPAGMTAEVAGEGSKGLAPLRGVRTTPEMAEAFQRQFAGERAVSNPYIRAILGLSTASKIAKTVLSQVTQVRNMTGNIGFALANGFLAEPAFLRAAAAPAIGAVGGGVAGAAVAPEGQGLGGAAAGAFAGAIAGTKLNAVTGATKGLQIGSILGEIGYRTDMSQREFINKLTRLGVIGDSARGVELQNALNSVQGKSIIEWFDNPSIRGRRKAARHAAGFAGRLYQVEDDVWKVIAFGVERQRYARALPDLADDVLDQRVADVVRETWPTFSQTPQVTKDLSRIGGFISFPSEVFRTISGTIGLIEKELADPATRKIGATRMAGLMSAGTAALAAGATSRKLHNVTGPEEAAVREFQAPWSKNSTFVHRQPVQDGKFAVVDVSYMDPYSYALAPLNAFMRGEDWWESTKAVAEEVASPWTSGNPIFSEFIKQTRNGEEFEQAAFNATLKGLTPGVADQYLRAISGRSSSLRPVDRQTELFALATGLRGEEQDIREPLRFMALDFNQAIRDATRGVSQAEARGGVTPGLTGRLDLRSGEAQLAGAEKDAHEAQIDAFNTIIKKVRAAQTLGLTRREINSILRASRVSERNRTLILAGAAKGS